VRLPGPWSISPPGAALLTAEGHRKAGSVGSPQEIFSLADVNDLLVEGGAGAAAAFLAADLVDRLIVYRAPILIGAGLSAIGDIGLASLADAHGRWTLIDAAALGTDRREVYERTR
jgi:diaminohydroxyphosphoribosylaminopyrimidine deaminase/5-amino-6-(5-phosphoribosylamino)uracil reductase